MKLFPTSYIEEFILYDSYVVVMKYGERLIATAQIVRSFEKLTATGQFRLALLNLAESKLISISDHYTDSSTTIPYRYALTKLGVDFVETALKSPSSPSSIYRDRKLDEFEGVLFDAWYDQEYDEKVLDAIARRVDVQQVDQALEAVGDALKHNTVAEAMGDSRFAAAGEIEGLRGQLRSQFIRKRLFVEGAKNSLSYIIKKGGSTVVVEAAKFAWKLIMSVFT